ncbi:MAG TPA: prefoldin subunit alpha [Thermoplasmata archaeon]|nr:prefoldin subunit alpha [Thermoplasmata archaeon]
MSATARPDPDQQVQEDLVRLEAYRAQFNALAQQHQFLAASRLEHSRARESLEGFDKVGSSPDLLVPIGGETYVHGSIRPDGKVLIGLGSGLLTEMDRSQAQELLAQRILQIEKATHELESNLQTLEDRIAMLSARVEALSRPAPAGGSEEAPDPGHVGRD